MQDSIKSWMIKRSTVWIPFTVDSFSITGTYPFFFLQLPQLHVLHALLLVGLLYRRNLFETFRSLKVINLWRQREMSEQDPKDILTPASLRFMTFFSWFLRRSWSSFFSFSSCSTCFAIMKSGSSSSRSYKNSCGRNHIRTPFLLGGVVLVHHIPTHSHQGVILRFPINQLFMFFIIGRQLKYLKKTQTCTNPELRLQL